MFDAEDFIADFTLHIPQRKCSISDVMDYMLPAHEEFGFQCRRLLHVLLKVGRMSILIMWAPKLREKIMICLYLKRRDALHACARLGRQDSW